MNYILSSVSFLLIFGAFCCTYLNLEKLHDERQFSEHAAIIAENVWNLHHTGTHSYLQLALKRDHFKTITFRELDGQEFFHLESEPLQGVDRYLHDLNLIWTRSMQTPVSYRGAVIGHLIGEQYVRIFFQLLNGGVVILALVLSALMISRLFSNRKHLEKLIRERTRNLIESERRFHDLVNLLPEMVWETDVDGCVQYANQIALLRLGLNGEEYGKRGTRWISAIVPEQRAQAANYFRGVVFEDAQGLQEFKAVDQHGVEFPMLIRSAPMMRDDQVVGARSVAIDITERHNLEEQLRRAQHMRTIGLMAGGVAHDLNNILSGVVTYPELLLMDLEKDHPLREGIETIRNSGLAAAEVVSDLLTVARGAAASRETTSLNKLVQEYMASAECAELCKRHPGVVVRADLRDDSVYISCSPMHVRKCIMNLLVNAVEAIENEGEVVLSTSVRALNNQKAGQTLLEDGYYSVLTVKDNGPGIDSKDLPHIFEPFYTKKIMGKSGTGLGLTVVWNTVQDHGGTVTVLRQNRETIFELYFPLVEDKRSTHTEETDLAAYRGAGETILLVDDEHHQREITVELLRSLNYTVSSAESGEEAVRLAKNRQHDLLILDMLMEPGQNGRAAYEKILQIHPDQRAIIVSGYAENADVKKAMELGAGAFISKPYTLAQLSRTVYQELQKKPLDAKC